MYHWKIMQITNVYSDYLPPPLSRIQKHQRILQSIFWPANKVKLLRNCTKKKHTHTKKTTRLQFWLKFTQLKDTSYGRRQYALLTYGNMPVQPRLRVKMFLKFKYENIVWLAFQKNLYSKTRLDGHITIREKSVFSPTFHDYSLLWWWIWIFGDFQFRTEKVFLLAKSLLILPNVNRGVGRNTQFKIFGSLN